MVVVVHETPFSLRALRSSCATSTSTATSSGGFAGCASVAAPFARLFRQCAVRRRSRTTCSFPPLLSDVSCYVARGGYRASPGAACKRSSVNREIKGYRAALKIALDTPQRSSFQECRGRYSIRTLSNLTCDIAYVKLVRGTGTCVGT